MYKTEREAYEAEAYRFYMEGIASQKEGDTDGARHCFAMAEDFLKSAKIEYTGSCENLSWSL